MFEKTLPIGTIVLLKGATEKLIIMGYAVVNPDETSGKVYDYVGCPYPQGYLSPDRNALFDHSAIERIYQLGYQDEERFAFEEKLKEQLGKIETGK